MDTMKKIISTISLSEVTRKEFAIFYYVAKESNDDLYQKLAHRRDDHFLFIFQKIGRSKIVVDFEEIELIENTIICILPGQVHYVISIDSGTEAWLMTVDSKLIDQSSRRIFEEKYFYNKSVSLDLIKSRFLNSCVELVASSGEADISLGVTHSIISACISFFADTYRQIGVSPNGFSRGDIITKQFRSSLLKHYRTHKSTSHYANELNITPAYLNEVVKEATGLTVSYWIQQIVMTEAKRLLYATDSTVKEISHQLGFEDHAYFNRYFSKSEGITPLQFRINYRK